MVLGSAIQTGDVVSRARAMDKLHRTEALQLLEEHLTVKPTDSDAITLHGTLLSWEGRYVEARSDLTKVLAAHPGHHDALRALINAEMWSDHPAEAERLAREALALELGDPDLILVRVRALTAMKRLREAGDLAATAVRMDPTNRRAADLGEDVADSLRQWKMSLGHSSQWFSDGRTPWNEDQMSLSRQTRTGSVIARFSNASRFGEQSRQGEIDYYPHLRRGTYAYLNFGYSPDAGLYPRYRAAGDIYQSLGHGLEVTAGYRRLSFGSGINIYTAAVTRYQGSWMFTGRTYLTPDSVGTSHSMHFSVRRYFGERLSYWSAGGGWGSSPTGIATLTDIGILNSSSVGTGFSHQFTRRASFSLQGGISSQDRARSSGLYDVELSAGLSYRF